MMAAHDKISRPYNTLPVPILNAMILLRSEIHSSLTLYTLDKIRQALRLGPAGGVDLRFDTLGVVTQQVRISDLIMCVDDDRVTHADITRFFSHDAVGLTAC